MLALALLWTSMALEDPKPAPPPEPVVRQASMRLGDRDLAYTSTAGTLSLKPDEEKEKARVFFVAYTQDGVDVATRPLTFVFNGGPGSSSVWLHLGAFGPVRVPMPDDATAPSLPCALQPNPWSLLDLTDLVFIDPVTTGYSRAVAGESDDQFHGLDADVRSVGEFIRSYTTRYGRWMSPKFLAGESYGTTRAAALSDHLQSRHGMFINGVVLISAILQFGTTEMDTGNDLPYALMLPTYAAIARYHGKSSYGAGASVLDAQREVEEFATSTYASALLRGTSLLDAQRTAVGAEVARFTGLPAGFVDDCALRPTLDRFAKALLRDQGFTVGRLDGRYRGLDRDDGGSGYEYDASYSAIQGAYTAAMNDYVRKTLGYESDLPYEILTGRVHPWPMSAENRYVDVAERLREAMNQNPRLCVFVAGGLHDMATPYFAAKYTLDHMGLRADARDRVQFDTYEAGHMMYVHGPSHAKLKADLARFYATTLARGAAPAVR